MALGKRQALLADHQINSPLVTYSSEPEPDTRTNVTSLHSTRPYCTNCNCNKCHGMFRNKRIHRRNKKHAHKMKKKKDNQIDKFERSNIWIKHLIKQSSDHDKEIHSIGVCKSYNFDEISVNDKFGIYYVFACYEETLHFKLHHQQKNDEESDINNVKLIVNDVDIFVFQNEGVIAFWNVDETNRYTFISLLREYEMKYGDNELSETFLPQTDDFDYGFRHEFEIDNGYIGLSINNCFDKNYVESWKDYYEYIFGENGSEVDIDNININMEHNEKQTDMKVERDESDAFMTETVNWIAVRGVLMMQKLAISCGLAQSLKLAMFEIRINENIELNADIPKQMAQNGLIGIGQKQTAQRMGRLFVLRSELNLHCDILDTPDVFWENDLFEKEYLSVRDYLDIDKRTEIINSRFDLLHELFEIVIAQQETTHASKLEWIIIWLIVIEVALGLIELIIEYYDQ